MADMNTEIKIGADASGVEAGVGRAKRSLKDLGDAALQASRDAAKGLGGVGEGGDKAARQVESATKSVVSSMQRQIAAFEAGGRGTRAYQESMARLNGIDVNAIKPLLDRLDESKAKSEAAAKSANTAAISFERMGISAKAASDTFSTLTVAGLGITAVVGAVTAVSKTLFDASVAAERLKIGLDFASGGNGARELAYVTDLSNKLGLSLQSTASSYMSFAAASRGTALEGAAAKNVFEAVAKASAVMGLTTEQSSGALLALQQMMSKGTVQAEELRGQLGERLPGAFQIAARAMGVTTQELGKMLETGKVLADDFLPKFAAQLENEIGGGAEKAANRLGAATNRMETALFRLKVALGDSGIAEMFASGLNRSTSIFNFIANDVEKLNSQGGLRKAADDVNTLSTRQTILKNGIANGFYGKGFQVELDAVSAKLEIAKQKFREVDAASKAILNGAGSGRGLVNPPTTTQLFAKDAANKAERDAYYAQDIRQTKEQIRTEEIGKARKANAVLVAKAEGDVNEVLKLQKALSVEIGNINDRHKDKKTGVEKTNPFDAIIKGVNERTAASKLGLEQDEKLTAGQRAAIPVLEALRNGTLKLTQAEAARYGEGLKAELQAEALNQSQQALIKAQKDFEASREKETVSRNNEILKIEEKAQALEDEIAAYGLGKAAIEAMTIARLEEKKAILEGFNGSEEEIARINAMIAARKRYAADSDKMAGLKAGTQAEEVLRNAKEQAKLYEDEYKLAGLTALERAKIVAQRKVELDYAKKLAELDKLPDGPEKESAKIKINEAELIEKNAAVAKVIQDDWAKTADQINQSLTDALMRGFESGKSFAMNLRDSLINMFKTMVLRPIISATLAPVGGMLAGVANAATGGDEGGGGLLGMGKNLMSMNSGWLTDFGATAVGQMSSTGAKLFSQGFESLGSSMMDTANSLAQYSDVISGAGDVLGYAGVLYNLSQGNYGAAIGGAIGTYFLGPIGGAIGSWLGGLLDGDGKPASKSTGDTTAVYDSTGKRLSTHAGFGHETEYTQASSDAMQRAYAAAAAQLGIKTVQSTFGTGGNSDGETTHFAVGSSAGGKSYQSADNLEYSKEAYSLEASRAVLAALQGSELPRYLSGVFDNITAGTATQEQITNILNYAGALKQFDETLKFLPFDNLREQSYGAMEGLIAASGGLEKLQGNLGFYFQNFYGESERAAAATASLAAEFAKLGIAVPDNAAQLRDLIAAQDISTEAGRNMAASLLGLAPAFYNVAAAARASAQQMMSIMADYASAGELRQFQLEEIQKGLAAGGVNITVDQLGGLSRDDAWKAYKDAVAAGDTRSADAIRDQLGAFAKVTTGAFTGGMFGTGGGGGGGNSGGSGGAADSIKSAWKSITDSIWGEVKRIRELLAGTGAAGYAQAQAKFAIALAQAQAFDQEAAKSLPELSRNMLELADNNVGSKLELQRIQGRTANSLEALGITYEDKYSLQTSATNANTNALLGLTAAMRAALGLPSASNPTTPVPTAANNSGLAGLNIPSFAVGTNYVPRDMLAMIHAGEEITPRAYNPAAGGQRSGGSDAATADALRRMADRLDAIEANTRAGAQHGGKTARLIERVMPDSDAIQVRETAKIGVPA